MREAVIDAGLIAPYSTRVFIGHLAEAGEFRMVGTEETRLEEIVASRQILARSRHVSASTRLEQALTDIERWKAHYRDAGLWRDCSTDDYLPTLATEENDEILETLWREYRTDPEDIHLAKTSVMCGLDALHSSNMNMIRDEDWSRIMAALRLPSPPVLCRREAIPSWSLGPSFDASPAETVINLALATMRPSDRLGAALSAWAARVQGAFPNLSRTIRSRLSDVAEASLRERCESLTAASANPITRSFLSSGHARPMSS